MNPTLWSYIGFIVAILILLWAALEFRTRFTRSSRKKPGVKTMNTTNAKNALNTWVTLDSTPIEAIQEEPQLLAVHEEDEEEDEQEDEAQHNLHIRAQQNGHYSQSKKPL